MGPDGNPHKATSEEDPGHVGLVLEWVYGSIVSTSEKERENAKRHLWPHTPPDATTCWHLLHAVRCPLSPSASMHSTHACTLIQVTLFGTAMPGVRAIAQLA